MLVECDGGFNLGGGTESEARFHDEPYTIR